MQSTSYLILLIYVFLISILLEELTLIKIILPDKNVASFNLKTLFMMENGTSNDAGDQL